MKRVLIIDDEKSGRNIVKQFLAPFLDDLYITEASSFKEAMSILKNTQKEEAFFLVFTDLNLEEFDHKEGIMIVSHIHTCLSDYTKVVLYSIGDPGWTVHKELIRCSKSVLFSSPIRELQDGKREYIILIQELLYGNIKPPIELNRTQIFISYSHADEKWLSTLCKYLKQFEDNGLLDIWNDQKIRFGSDWFSEIKQKLNSAKVFILLVSTDFINSDFIKNNELPKILNKAENNDTLIIPIMVKNCTYELTVLKNFQSANYSNPLSRMTDNEVEDFFIGLARKINELLQKGQQSMIAN